MTHPSRRTAALRRLPVLHARALRLRDEGRSTEQVAEELGLEPEAVGPLLAVAEAKLATLLEE
ncbi:MULTISPECIES: hypothetical protein [unclassified Saccharothrix]|uniref:hypothetical protein n=1 Tax=unclassified Saccharothrix TaxID=2593673 RepID=UPI00307E18EA